MKITTLKATNRAPSNRWRKFFSRRRRRHDAMLVLNMALFNSGSDWDRIFGPAPRYENVW